MFKVVTSFSRYDRSYFSGREYDFTEFPRETRDAEIEELIKNGQIESPVIQGVVGEANATVDQFNLFETQHQG